MDTKDLALKLGLTEEEFERAVHLTGRELTMEEVAVYSAMWNEHVSYKSSRRYLKTLPTRGEAVVLGPGENSGVVSIGDGWLAAFKMESHNHPSYIEPFQGAATGVGGILRDIFTMGARPIASMDSLRFGAVDHPKTQFLASGVVHGISAYGNCVGVPTVGGELDFDPTYDGNILVNVFTLGVMPKKRLFTAQARGIGNAVIYMGSPTGRDGIGGAIMASHTFEGDSEGKKPTVQAGDPFMEKLIMEATLELMEAGLVQAVQDMGAAGLTCSTFEMAHKGGVGMAIDLNNVPKRVEGISAIELLLSESQERMLVVSPKGREAEVLGILEKWGVPAAVIGHIQDEQVVSMTWKGREVVRLSPDWVVGDAPLYNRPTADPLVLAKRRAPVDMPEITANEAFEAVVSHPSIRSGAWVWQQYDHMVGAATVLPPGEGDAAVVRVNEKAPGGLAMSVDGDQDVTWLDPQTGGYNCVAESALNCAVTGAKPIALTNCLNFGNPEKPEVMLEFAQAVKGIARACTDFHIPVTGGNVSLYNESNGVSIKPTPTIAVVGVLDDVADAVPMAIRDKDLRLAMVGDERRTMAGSLLQRLKAPHLGGTPVQANPELHNNLMHFLQAAASRHMLAAAHDISKGGLAAALFEMVQAGGFRYGLKATLPGGMGGPPMVQLFGEGPSRVIITYYLEYENALFDLATQFKLDPVFLGETMADLFIIEPFLSYTLQELTVLTKG